MDEREVWLTYASVPGIGRRRLCDLMDHFPSAADAWQASLADLVAVQGIHRSLAAALVAARSRPQGAALLERLEALGGEMVLFRRQGYPKRLEDIPDPPPYFFRLGPAPLDRPAVAVVGSRKATAYGRSVARRLAADLAAAGVTVVSGLARGIDAEAHLGALSVRGITVAVLGCGPDVFYPAEHRRLHEEIAQSGVIVSEQPPGALPERHHFPERNRLISGLSLGVVVVEAGEKSGALITADCATEQGRDVLAVPGSVHSPMSRGPHALIQEGAVLVQTAEEVITALLPGARTGPGGGRPARQERPASKAGELTADEAALYAWIGDGPVGIDDLAVGTGLPAHRLAAALTTLELKGIIRTLPEGQVMRT